MHPARLSLIALSLLCVPAVSFAEESTSTGSTLVERLAVLSNGAIPLKDLTMSDKNRTAWTAETNRYDERSAELRSRCHEEIRKANRDTLVSKAGQCLRGDLLLEIGHRRKQRELLEGWSTDTRASIMGINAWIEGANAVIDGLDAGVFTTIDTLKEAKSNLHSLYRQPMYTYLELDRLAALEALTRSLALSVHTAMSDLDDPSSLLADIVPCLEEAHSHATTIPTDPYISPMQRLRSTATTLRTCVALLTPSEDR